MKRSRLLIFLATILVLAISQRTLSAQISNVESVDDPQRDGWSTEVIQARIATQWRQFASLLAARDPVSTADVADWVSTSYRGTDLRPTVLRTIFQDGTVTVRRAANERLSQSWFGTDGFVASCQSLQRAIGKSDIQEQFKIYRVTSKNRRIVTHQRVTLAGSGGKERRELHAIWIANWTLSDSTEQPLRLESIELQGYEETVRQGETLFADCTEAVLGSNACYGQQLVYSLDYWSNRILQVDSSGMQGCAVGDVNGDGLDDVYLCQASWLPNRLFVQSANGQAVDVSAESGVDWHEQSHGALIIDLDNDGDQDLAISTTLGLMLMENDGSGRFSLRHTAREASGAYSIAAADFDLDGNLDIFCCVYIPRALRRQILAAPVPIHDARNGGRNVLLRNAGSWRFEDVTVAAGLEPEASRRSFACSWEDYDNDGDSDLYVANDYGRNNLFRNDDGIFTNVAGAAGVEDQSFGMSSAWGDANRDGWIDLYVANMFSAAGNRIVYQPNFRPGDTDETRGHLQYMARGNSLFQNQADGTFRDVSDDAGVMLGLWSWGCPFVDVNNDGNEDLLVANGYYSRTDSRDL